VQVLTLDELRNVLSCEAILTESMSRGKQGKNNKKTLISDKKTQFYCFND